MNVGSVSRILLIVLVGGFALPGCGGEEDRREGRLVIWAHRGKPAEWATLVAQVDAFQAAHADLELRLVEIAEGDYDTQVQAAAASGELPDVLELDGPLVANYVWKGYLRRLDDLLPRALQEDLLPSILEQGRISGHLYAVGIFDSGLGLYADARQLRALGVRVPAGPASAWTADEMSSLLERLAEEERKAGEDGRVLDLKRDYRGEWWTYGFYPILVGAGADLIDREKLRAADTLDSAAAIGALQTLQRWNSRELVDPNVDGRAFVDRRVALSWTGHWDHPRYRDALGEDLLVLPLPDFGTGSRTAMGSWCWGITRRCADPQGAARFLSHLLEPEQVLAMTEANGAVPARRSAIAASPLYGPEGALRLFAEQLESTAVPRPRTPAYPVITSAFREALLAILSGAPVAERLSAAVEIIDRDIVENQGYPMPESDG